VKEPVTATAVEPANVPDDKPVAPKAVAKQVEVLFDSLPSGGVYAEGKSAELCRTPCKHNLEVVEGDSSLRTFIVKTDGYRDGAIVIDLTTTKREFSVTLEQLTPTDSPDQPHQGDQVDEVHQDHQDHQDRRQEARHDDRAG
jgi:hypothetical protein